MLPSTNPGITVTSSTVLISPGAEPQSSVVLDEHEGSISESQALYCDNETLYHVINTVKKVSNHYVDNCGFKGVNILNASGV